MPLLHGAKSQSAAFDCAICRSYLLFYIWGLVTWNYLLFLFSICCLTEYVLMSLPICAISCFVTCEWATSCFGSSRLNLFSVHLKVSLKLYLQFSFQNVALNPRPEMLSSEKNRTVRWLETLLMIRGGTLPQNRPEKPCKISSNTWNN